MSGVEVIIIIIIIIGGSYLMGSWLGNPPMGHGCRYPTTLRSRGLLVAISRGMKVNHTHWSTIQRLRYLKVY